MLLQFFHCTFCKGYNDILNVQCPYCLILDARPEHITYHYQALVEIERGIFGRRGCLMADSTEDLFVKFYNHEKILIKDMDIATLRQHREELSKVAYEAKARLTAADDELRERKAKDPKAPWLISTNDNPSVSDAISTVKTRAARMSKMDKLRQQLRDSGIDDDTVDDMIKNLERKATEKNLKSVNFPDKKPVVIEKPSVEQSVVMVEVKESKPFDPSSLFGAK